MSHPFTTNPDDSTRDVLGAWNLGDDDPAGDSLFSPDTRADLPPAVFGTPGADAPFLHFTLGPGFAGQADSLGLPPVEPRDRGKVADAGASLPAPKPGETLGGYRIVTELGRGAFARVYLAEQVDLGDRRVALKVSRAEGDEPQMLARLQHTHIVPIHSVHDDPRTGLRLLCMPYLGGANLAQVLEAAGSNPSEGAAGRSLVAALDEVSRRLVSRPDPRASLFSSGTPGEPAAGAKPGARASSRYGSLREWASLPAGLRGGSLDRFQALLGRFNVSCRGGVSPRPDAAADDLDFDHPARQFLRGANTVQAAVWVVARLAEGLEHAHSRGLLHRDLKPSNVLIAGDGTPMLLDFNLSTSTHPGLPAEGEKAMLGGTLPYMAPEHLDAFNPKGTTRPDAVDERSDIYSLGLILFEMLAGAHPFPEPPGSLPLLDTIRHMADQRRHPPSLRKVNPEVPWSLDAVVGKCLASDPAARYARARDLAEDLARFLDDLPNRHAPEPSPRERFAKWARRNPRLCGTTPVASLAVLLLAGLCVLIGLMHANVQGLSTRLKLQVFRNDFAQCRFLLNVTGGPAEHLDRGLALARKTIDQQRIGRDGRWRSDSWAFGLTPKEQGDLREQTAELILLDARARVHRASLNGSEADRAKALELAVASLGRAERLDPKPPAALYTDRARYLNALGRADLAAVDRRRESETPPVSGRDFALLGSSHLSRGDLAAAEPALRRAVDLDPRAFWSWFALGHCHAEQGRHLEAAGDFNACAVLEPGFAWPHMNRGLSLARAGRTAEARSAYDRALQANPSFSEAWLNRGLADLELDDPAAADTALGRAVSLGRREAEVYAAWAQVKARRGDRAGAESLFDRLLRDRPDSPALLTARGVFRIAADRAGALVDLRRALSLDPRLARAHYGLALLYRTSEPAAALSEADAALAADPDLIDALMLRAVLRGRLGNPAAVDDAERLLLLPTRHRLYNAACALAQLIATTGDDRLAPRALDALDRALDAGFPAAHAASDHDLAPLRGHAGFRTVLDKPRRP